MTPEQYRLFRDASAPWITASVLEFLERFPAHSFTITNLVDDLRGRRDIPDAFSAIPPFRQMDVVWDSIDALCADYLIGVNRNSPCFLFSHRGLLDAIALASKPEEST